MDVDINTPLELVGFLLGAGFIVGFVFLLAYLFKTKDD